MKEIFAVVCFPQPYIEAKRIYHTFDKRFSEEEKAVKDEEFKKWKETPEYRNLYCGGVTKGIFLTQQDAIDLIKRESEYVSECHYYTFIVIEKRYIGWEGYSIMEDDTEYWMELKEGGYEAIEKPEIFASTFAFMS